MMRRAARWCAGVIALASVAGAPLITGAGAQSRTVAPICIACKRAAGIRLNYRDRDLERVDGFNITLWGPHDPPTGVVNGFALGLPGTGAATISGFAIAPAGFAAGERFGGIGVAGLGYGIGESARGILVAGLGGGIGGNFTGITVAGLGNGIGGSVDGILIAGLGAGVAGRMRGLAVAGLGTGGGSIEGIMIAGLGAGVGGSVRGLAIAGLGVGAGDAVEGILIAGVGAGAGRVVKGLAIGGLGIGSPSLRGIVISPVVRSGDEHGAVVALSNRALVKDGEASVRGIVVAPVNDVRGMQRGVSVAIVNYARALKGLQVGVVNIVTDGRGPKIMPVVNWR